MQPLKTKKIRQPLGTKQSRNLWDNKIMHLSGQKKSLLLRKTCPAIFKYQMFILKICIVEAVDEVDRVAKTVDRGSTATRKF